MPALAPLESVLDAEGETFGRGSVEVELFGEVAFGELLESSICVVL